MITFDPEEINCQINQLRDLIDTLRPYPGAQLVSFQKMEMIAAASGDEDLTTIVRHADPQKTLFWLVDGEYIEQRVRIEEFPAS